MSEASALSQPHAEADQGFVSPEFATGTGEEAPTDPSVTDTHSFHQYVSFKNLDAGRFEKLPRWKRKAILGKVERHCWRPEGTEEKILVCVKIMQNELVDRSRHTEANDKEAFREGLSISEDALNEIGVYSYLQQVDSCPYLLRMHGVFRSPVSTWLVTENCNGDFFDFIERQRDEGQLSENKIAGHISMLLKAVSHLHEHNIGHCDISLENLLFKDGELRLMDFGQAVKLRADDGTALRYFRLRGKDKYRAPECYAPPKCLQVQIPVGEDQKPGQVMQVVGGGYMCNVRLPLDAAPGKTSIVDMWGYEAAMNDVFACGVVLVIRHTQAAPWNEAVQGDAGFRYAWQFGAAELCNKFNHPFESTPAVELINGMLEGRTTKRWTLSQCMDSAFFGSAPQSC